MDDLELSKANEPEVIEYTHRARCALLMLLDGQLPPEGEDYGPWKLPMSLLRWGLECGGAEGVQKELRGVLANEVAWAKTLLDGAMTPDGRPWREVLEEEQRAQDEAQVREERREAIIAKAEAQAEEQRERARQRARMKEIDEEWRARGWKEERTKRTPKKEWTLIELAEDILWFLTDKDYSRSQISALYHGNISADRLNDALDYLELQGKARCKRVSSGGRPREVWTTWWAKES